MYSMLMTAMATDITIAVETAGDCAGAEGDERPKRVWFDASAAVKANPVTPVETITTYKTVAYAADMGGTVQTTLKAPTGRYYMGRSNIANGSVCYCLDGSKMVNVAGTGNKSCPAGTTNRYASYRQYVIEVDAPLVTS
jgi:hypothetical protein